MGLKVFAKKGLYFIVAQVVTAITVLACCRLRFFIGENLFVAFKAVNSLFPD